VGGRRGTGAEVREDQVDHRRLGNAGHDPHGAGAGGAREGVDFKELLQQRRRWALAQRRVDSVGASRGAGTIAGGISASAGSA